MCTGQESNPQSFGYGTMLQPTTLARAENHFLAGKEASPSFNPDTTRAKTSNPVPLAHFGGNAKKKLTFKIVSLN